MSFFNEKQIAAMFGGTYVCSKCGAKMEFEDEAEDILVCPTCGHSVDLDLYGSEDEEDYSALYPTEDDIFDEEEDEDYCGETYDEVCGELSND